MIVVVYRELGFVGSWIRLIYRQTKRNHPFPENEKALQTLRLRFTTTCGPERGEPYHPFKTCTACKFCTSSINLDVSSTCLSSGECKKANEFKGFFWNITSQCPQILRTFIFLLVFRLLCLTSSHCTTPSAHFD